MKSVIIFDIDDTLLFRRSLRINLLLEDICPTPNLLYSDEHTLVYLRPGVHAALTHAKEHASMLVAFSASPDPHVILEKTGLLDYFDRVFGLAYTLPEMMKPLLGIRHALNLDPSIHVFMIDDHSEHIVLSCAHDHAIPIKPFMPAFKLFGTQIYKNPADDDPTDCVPEDSHLLTCVNQIVEAISFRTD
jgi:FMN phosphatase YigB (HAD superfamily)